MRKQPGSGQCRVDWTELSSYWDPIDEWDRYWVRLQFRGSEPWYFIKLQWFNFPPFKSFRPTCLMNYASGNCQNLEWQRRQSQRTDPSIHHAERSWCRWFSSHPWSNFILHFLSPARWRKKRLVGHLGQRLSTFSDHGSLEGRTEPPGDRASDWSAGACWCRFVWNKVREYYIFGTM